MFQVTHSSLFVSNQYPTTTYVTSSVARPYWPHMQTMTSFVYITKPLYWLIEYASLFYLLLLIGWKALLLACDWTTHVPGIASLYSCVMIGEELSGTRLNTRDVSVVWSWGYCGSQAAAGGQRKGLHLPLSLPGFPPIVTVMIMMTLHAAGCRH